MGNFLLCKVLRGNPHPHPHLPLKVGVINLLCRVGHWYSSAQGTCHDYWGGTFLCQIARGSVDQKGRGSGVVGGEY